MQVNPKVNWKLKSRRIFEIAVVISLSVHIAFFLSFREFKSQEILVDFSSKILNMEDIPETEQFVRPPPQAAPAVPVESLDENLLDDISIEDGGFSVPEEILRIEKEMSFDLIVMGTHGRGRTGNLEVGNVADKVVRYSSCPVVTVNRTGKLIDISESYSRIVAPVDFSDYSKVGLRYAVEFAGIFEAELYIMRVLRKCQNKCPEFLGFGSQP